MSITVLIFVIVGVIFAAGWIPLGIRGIVALKKQRRGAGLIMTILASIWCIVAIFTIFVSAIGWLAYSEVAKNNYKYETFNPATYQGKTGTLKLDGWDGIASFSTRGKDKTNMTFNATDGKFILPVGEHEISYLSLSRTTDHNQAWSASISPKSWSNPFKINIEENKTANFPTGEPFKLEITTKQKNGSYTLSMAMQDKAGHKAMIYSPGNVKPSVQLLDDTGKVIWEKAMEYG